MKPFSSHRRKVATALSLAVLLGSFSAFGQNALPKVITLVVPQAVGGSNDVFARAVAARLPRFLDSAVVVENRQGAGGNIGSAWVAKSAPRDGSVWLVTVNSTQTVNPILYSKPGFDPIADFEPVSGIALVPHVLLANNNVPANSMANLLTLASKDPGKYSFGSAGNGTFSHLLMEYMKHSQKVQLVHVPYKGVAPALTDLIGGQIHYLISTIPAAMPFIKSGQVKPISVLSLTRSSALPNVPLANDTVAGMVVELWVAIYAPKGTSREAISQMRNAVAKVQALPEMEEFFAAQGATQLKIGPTELLSLTRAESEKWGPIVRESGMKVD
jgi:tripartite-type tricarboxylate transporter receptor subunit TctC